MARRGSKEIARAFNAMVSTGVEIPVLVCRGPCRVQVRTRFGQVRKESLMGGEKFRLSGAEALENGQVALFMVPLDMKGWARIEVTTASLGQVLERDQVRALIDMVDTQIELTEAEEKRKQVIVEKAEEERRFTENEAYGTW